MGLGFTLAHDRIGISRDLEMAGHYAYKVRTGEYGQLSFGLKAGLSIYSARLTDLVYWDANDPLYQQNISNQAGRQIRLRLVLAGRPQSFVGLSVPTLYAAADGAITMDAAGCAWTTISRSTTTCTLGMCSTSTRTST